jgi:ATP-binding cassette, subfamily A (ABC1), member 3
VDDVSLTMNQGEIFALLGHNGAGKTTTIGILTGLLAPTSGTASILGHSIATGLPAIRRIVGVCPQHDILFDELTAEEHLKIYGRLKRFRGSEQELEREIQELMDEVGLEPNPPSTRSKAYSGGMKRKLSLCIALIAGSRLIFLDECTAGVDPCMCATAAAVAAMCHHESLAD